MSTTVRTVCLLLLGFVISYSSQAQILDDHCVVNILNRTVQVGKDGSWAMPNVPSQMGRIRARATCTRFGETFSGESDYFNVQQNGIVNVPHIQFDRLDPIPVRLSISEPTLETLTQAGAGGQLKVLAHYRDGSSQALAENADGLNYASTNPGIVTIDANGRLTALASGSALISVRKDEVVSFKRITVMLDGDSDHDGLADDFERANGLDVNDPLDALEDPDADGLTTLQEYKLGSDFRRADSDGDGLDDGTEVNGTNGFVSDPLKTDTDGDGVQDRDEILAGYDPSNPEDGGGRGFVELLVSPSNPRMTYNTLYKESNLQIQVMGKRRDGSTLDLTSKASGTTYASSDLSVVSFGSKDGLLFAGQNGRAALTVRNAGLERTVDIEVNAFDPRLVTSINIPGYANNVDVAGDFAYVAAGSQGLQILDVSHHEQPAIIASLDTPGTAIDVRVVGNLLYLADGEQGLRIIDVSNPRAPNTLAVYDTAGIAQDVKVDRQFVYIADGIAGLEIVDVHRPQQPLFMATVTGLGEVKGVDVKDDQLVVVAGSALYAINVSDRHNPIQQGRLNIGPVKDVAFDGRYAHVAAHTSGWKTVDVADPLQLRVTAGAVDFVPRDIELTDGFAFAAEELFRTFAVYLNIEQPERPFFQGTIDIARLGSHYGTGLAIDGNYLYLTGQRTNIEQDYGYEGSTHLLIVQYRLLEDQGQVPPTLSILQPDDDTDVIEGQTVDVSVDADDDIGVKTVSFLRDGQVVYTDSTRPYQYPLFIPWGGSQTPLALSAKATDFGGNTQLSLAVTLNVHADGDHDGLSDAQELSHGTDVDNPDSDQDGLQDGEEVYRHTFPDDSDSDDDGIVDGEEVRAGTDPLNADTTAPKMLETLPRDQTTQTPENTPIVVMFDEPLSAKSIGPDSLVVHEGLLLDGARIDGSLRLASDGLQLIFKPNDLLADFTDYRITVSNVRDRAGNPLLQAQSFQFKTGNTLDYTAPTIVTVEPSADSGGVPVNSQIGIVFSEAIDVDTLDEQSVMLVDDVIAEAVPGVISLGEDAQRVTFIPNRPLAVGRQYRIKLTAQIKDLFGNPLSNRSFVFSTSFDKDAAGPRLLGFSIHEGQTVPINGQLQIQFDEAISGLMLHGVVLRKGRDEVALTRELSADRKTLSLKPLQPLSANASYRIDVEDVRDLSGNVLATAEMRHFMTGSQADVSPSTIVQYSPSDNAVGVATNGLIEIAFADALNPLTVNAQSVRLYDDQLWQLQDVVLNLSTDGKRLTVKPTQSLAANRHYWLSLSNQVRIYDLVGNAIKFLQVGFMTGADADLEGPRVSMQNLEDGVRGVAVNSRLNFTFDEPFSPLSVVSSVLTSQGIEVPGSLSMAADYRSLSFKPDNALNVDTDYRITLTGLYDAAGNAMTPVNSGFRTASTSQWDVTRPNFNLSPAFAAQNISVDTPIRFTFDEAIDVSSLEEGITIKASGFKGELAGQLSIEGNVVTFQPMTPFPGNTQILITTQGIRDRAGNVGTSSYHYFTTGTPSDRVAPKLLSITPSDGALDVNPQDAIVLTFSESLDQRTVTPQSVGLFVNGQLVQPTLGYSADNRTLTLRYGLPKASLVTVLLTDDIKDLSGNPLQNSATAFATANFDSLRPSIVTAFPGNGAYDVLPGNDIVLYSNEALQASSLQAAMHVSQNGVLIDGDWELTGQNQALIFRPTRPFEHDAIIELFLDSNARDLAGNALNTFQTQFRIVEDPAQTPPYVVTTNQDGILPLNPVFDLQFNEALAPDGIDEAAFSVQNGEDGSSVAVDIRMLKGNRLLRLIPTQALLPHHDYYVAQTGNVRDAGGQVSAPNVNRRWRFQTGDVNDEMPPQIIALSPEEDAQDIGINSRLGMRFDEPVNPLSFLSEQADQPVAQIVQGGDARLYSLMFSSDHRQVSYVPHRPLPSDSDVSPMIQGIEDYAGHALLERSWQFHTSAGPHTDALKIERWNVDSYASNVPVNALFTLRSNRYLDILTIDEGSFRLRDDVTYEGVAATRSLSADGRTLTLVPTQALAVGRRYCLAVSGVQDMSGNRLGESHCFNAAMTADMQAPSMLGFSLTHLQRGVALNPQIHLQFDEPLNVFSLDGVRLMQGDEPMPLLIEWSEDHSVLKLKLLRSLLPYHDYRLEVAGVEDLSGHRLQAVQSLMFQTGDKADLQPPQVQERSPAASSEGISVNVPIVLSFSEAINPLSLNDQSLKVLEMATGQPIAVQRELSDDGRKLTLRPHTSLNAHHRYKVVLSGILDQAGLIMNSTQWSFTTGEFNDRDAPVITALSIGDGATAVPINGRLRILFDEVISPFSVPGSLRLEAQDVEVAGSLELAKDRRSVTFTPSQPLASNGVYRVIVDGFYDDSGNRLPASSSQFMTSQTTTADKLPPKASITPGSGLRDVGVNATISLSFDEEIDVTSLDEGIRILVEGFSGEVAGHFSYQDRLATFHPYAPFPGNKRIDVRVEAVKDWAGNTLVTSSQFVTGAAMDLTPPSLQAISPQDGALDVDTLAPIVLTFSESLNQRTVNQNTVALFVDGHWEQPAISFAGDNRSIVLYEGLPSSSLVTVLLTREIQDLSGNPLPDTTRVFATVASSDTRRPYILSSFPGYGAFNVQTKTKIVLYSDEALQADSVQKAFHVSQNGRLVDGDLQVSGNGRSIVFAPSQPWAKGALIEVFVDSTARDLAGNALSSFQNLFSIEPDQTLESPYVVATNLDDAIELPANAVMDVQFNEPLDPLSVNDGTLVLHDAQTHTPWPISVDLIKAGRVVRVQATAPLPAGEYVLGMRPGLKDATGVECEYFGDHLWYFRVANHEDLKAPLVDGLSPGDGAVNIGLNSRIGMRFDEAVNPLSFLSDDADAPLAQVQRYEDVREHSLSFSEQNRYVVYQPHEPWPADSDVALTVAAVEDYAGHGVQALTHRFHTAMSVDLQSPWVDVWSFNRDAVGVPVNASLQLRVNEVLDPLSVVNGGLTLRETLNGLLIPASSRLSLDGQTLTLVPDQALALGRRYTLDASQVKDMNGNKLYETRSFTTAFVADVQPPQVMTYSLEAEQTDVATNAQLHMAFDEAVNPLTLEGVALYHDQDRLTLTPTLSNDNKRLRLELIQPLQPHTRYTLKIQGVADLSGNLMTEQARSFTTGSGADLYLPMLTRFVPASQASGVGVNARIELDFSEAIDPVSLQGDGVRLLDRQSMQIVPTTIAVSDDRRQVVIMPSSPLVAARQYTVYVSYYGTIYDQAGNRLSSTSWSFSP